MPFLLWFFFITFITLRPCPLHTNKIKLNNNIYHFNVESKFLACYTQQILQWTSLNNFYKAAYLVENITGSSCQYITLPIYIRESQTDNLLMSYFPLKKNAQKASSSLIKRTLLSEKKRCWFNLSYCKGIMISSLLHQLFWKCLSEERKARAFTLVHIFMAQLLFNCFQRSSYFVYRCN